MNNDIEYFSLETLLEVATGISFNGDFEEEINLASFVFSDDKIESMEICLPKVRDALKEHILTIYPEFSNINSKEESKEFINKLRLTYGEILPMCRKGQTLDDNKGKAR